MSPAQLEKALRRIEFQLRTIRHHQAATSPAQRTQRTRAINSLAREARYLYRVNAGLPPME